MSSARLDHMKRYISLLYRLIATLINEFSEFFNGSFSLEPKVLITLEVVETRKSCDIKCTTEIIVVFDLTIYDAHFKIVLWCLNFSKLIPSRHHFLAVSTPGGKEHKKPSTILESVC